MINPEYFNVKEFFDFAEKNIITEDTDVRSCIFYLNTITDFKDYNKEELITLLSSKDKETNDYARQILINIKQDLI